MSDANRDDVADIRGCLWQLLAELREGEVDAEVAGCMTEVLDSLIDLTRLEGELRRQGTEGEAGRKDAERTT